MVMNYLYNYTICALQDCHSNYIICCKKYSLCSILQKRRSIPKSHDGVLSFYQPDIHICCERMLRVLRVLRVLLIASTDGSSSVKTSITKSVRLMSGLGLINVRVNVRINVRNGINATITSNVRINVRINVNIKIRINVKIGINARISIGNHTGRSAIND